MLRNHAQTVAPLEECVESQLRATGSAGQKVQRGSRDAVRDALQRMSNDSEDPVERL